VSEAKAESAEKESSWWQTAFKYVGVLARTPRTFALIWRADWKLTIGLLLLTTILALVPMIEIEITRLILDALTNELAGPLLKVLVIPLIIVMTLVGLIHNCLRPTARAWSGQLGDYLHRDINSLVLQKANSFPGMALFESPDVYEKLRKVEGQAGWKPLHMLDSLESLIQGVVTVISMMFVLIMFNPILALVVMAFAIPHVAIQIVHNKQSWALQGHESKEVRRMYYYSYILTAKHFASEVRVFGLGDFFLGRYLEQFNAYFHRHQQLRNKHWRESAALALLFAVGTGGGYAYIGFVTIIGAITVGAMMLYISAIDRVTYGISNIVHTLTSLYESNVFIDDLYNFLDIPQEMPLVPPEYAQEMKEELTTGIEFRNVQFHYPEADKMVLKDVSFKIKPGQTMALVGENGAGKSTLVKLLSRLYDPTKGQILIDGVNMPEFDIEKYRSKVSVIFQDFTTYNLSARDNIGFGQVHHFEDMEMIKRAADRGGAREMIEELDNGFDTLLGQWFEHDEKGTDLSGGQWQKMALARAFMRSLGAAAKDKSGDEDGGAKYLDSDAQILILDEPTAALDAKAEYEVYSRFHELTKGRTTLLISHRFSTVRMADVIVLLDDGVITEQGSHDELMELNGAYAKLYNLQADRYK